MSISPTGKYIATASGVHNVLYIHSLEVCSDYLEHLALLTSFLELPADL